MDISQSQGQHRLRAFCSSMFVGIGGFKGQQVEVRPTGWENYIRNFLQRYQRGRAPFMPIVLPM